MDRRSPTTEGEDRLTAFPAELLVNVFEQLHVREICRLRSLNRHFHEFVDTNQGALTQDIISFHRVRIHREYTNLTDLSDCDIIDALRRYDSHYGFAADLRVTRSSISKLKAISPTLSFNWIKSHGFPAAEQDRAVRTWMQLYTIISHPDNLGSVIEQHINAAVDMCRQSHLWSQGLTDDEGFKAKLTRTASTRLDATYPVVPMNLITQRNAVTKDISPWSFQWRDLQNLSDHWEKLKLEQLLDLPDLQSKKGSLAYCIRSGQTASLLRKMKQGSSTRLELAAVIEKLFIW